MKRFIGPRDDEVVDEPQVGLRQPTACHLKSIREQFGTSQMTGRHPLVLPVLEVPASAAPNVTDCQFRQRYIDKSFNGALEKTTSLTQDVINNGRRIATFTTR